MTNPGFLTGVLFFEISEYISTDSCALYSNDQKHLAIVLMAIICYLSFGFTSVIKQSLVR